MTGPSEATPAGQGAPVEFLLENPGPDRALDITLKVDYGAGLRGGGVFDCEAIKLSQCPLAGFTGDLPRLDSGGSIRFTISPYVEDGTTGNVSVSGTVSASNDEVLTDNGGMVMVPTYTDEVSVVASTSANDVTAGSSVPFQFVVTNAGPDAARNLTLTRTLGGKQTVISTLCAASGGATCPASLGATMSVPSLPTGGTLTFTVTSQVAADALASISAGLRADALGDLKFDDNYSEATAYLHANPVLASTPSFVLFQSDQMNPTVPARDYAYTRVNSVMTLQQYSYYIDLAIHGNEDWTTDVAWPSTATRFEPGLYVDPVGSPFTNSTTGGLTVSAPDGGCEHIDWFRVLDATYNGADLATLDLVFAQACKGRANAIHGQIHWVANDPSGPPGPVNPPPAGLWSPASGATPATGNYVYLEGDAAEPIMHGTSASFTPTESTLSVSDQHGDLSFYVSNSTTYSGDLHAMAPYTAVVPGYYAIDPQAPIWNPVNPTLKVGSRDFQCSDAIGGWFVVDSVAHANGALTAVDARFEQRCGTQGTLHGQIHWVSN